MHETTRSQITARSIAGWALMLTIAAICSIGANLLQPAPAQAQSPPVASPQPDVPNADGQVDRNSNLWLWLLIPLLGGGLLWLLKSSRSNSAPAVIEPAQEVPTDLVAPVTPVMSGAMPIPHESPLDSNLERDLFASNFPDRSKSDVTDDKWVQANIQLLEERLVVDLQSRKTGEVIVRKEIETQIVEVPIRREVLIVEQISPEFKQLAVIDLGQERAAQYAATPETGWSPTVETKFTSVSEAIQFLEELSQPHPKQKSTRNGTSTRSDLPPEQIDSAIKDVDARTAY
jgi:hypothetical protein